MDKMGDKLTDPAFFATYDPHPLWKRMRAEDPVHWATGNLSKGFWSITKYEDALTVLRDPMTFSSEALGMSMPTRDLEDFDRSEMGCGAMIIAMDPPRHNPMRRALSKNFLRSHVGQWEERCRRVVKELIDRVAPLGRCDFVTDVAQQLPMLMILEMMEIPPEDRATLLRWAAMTVGNDDPEFQVGSSLESRRQGNFAIYDYSRRIALERRGGAGSDLLTVMGNAVVMGEQLSERELGFTGDMFVLAGIETTRTALADGMLELLRNRTERRKLQERPDLLPSAIEEILRWTSPVGHILRVATADAEIRGRSIRAGDKVVVWTPSANRDEEVFADADRFDLERTPNEHIAFGYGEHFCLGAHLARLELRVMVEELLRRLPDMELDGPVQRLHSIQLFGPKHIPVKFTPAPL
ncbi:MAG: cytochrome P450 [Candidatus Binataceae bacterium]